jgi:hypothetical protein
LLCLFWEKDLTGLDHKTPILHFLPSLGWQVCTTTSSFSPLRWGQVNFCLPRLASNYDPPDLSLLYSLEWQVRGHWHLALPFFRIFYFCITIFPLLVSRPSTSCAFRDDPRNLNVHNELIQR